MTNLAAFTFLFVLAGCTNEPDPPGLGIAGHRPLVVIGIDGATWDVIDPMIANGELPNLASLKAQGAWGPLITVGPQVSPVVWTSFSTGQFGRIHGILDFAYPYQPGPKRPVQSTERQVPALWNLVSEAGGKVSVVGYFVTYPAEKINGVMVSYKSRQMQPDADYPADALAPIREQLDSIFAAEKKTLWSRFLPWDFDPANPPAENEPAAEAFRMVSGRVERRILSAEYNRRAALYLAQSPHDLFISYFGMVDSSSHSLWKFMDDADFELKASPESKRLLGNVIHESYRFIDEFIGDLLVRSPVNANFVIISDHGFGSATGLFGVKEHNKNRLTGNHRPIGIFLAAGPDIQAGRIDGLTIMDVFPVLAYLAGIPVADDLPGDLDLRLFTDEILAEKPPFFTRTYANSGPAVVNAAGASHAAQEESIKALQGLGYVSESFEFGFIDTQTFDFWVSEHALVIRHLVGEVSFYLLKGDNETASAILAEARSHDDILPPKILLRCQILLRSIRDMIGEQAVSDSAFAFIRSARSSEAARIEQNSPASGE